MRLPFSTSDWFLKAVVLCYERPGEALERMEKFSVHRGQGALLKKLAGQPGYFGRCSFAARVVRGSSTASQREARSAAALLSLLAMEAIEARAPAVKSSRRTAEPRAGKRGRNSLLARTELARRA